MLQAQRRALHQRWACNTAAASCCRIGWDSQWQRKYGAVCEAISSALNQCVAHTAVLGCQLACVAPTADLSCQLASGSSVKHRVMGIAGKRANALPQSSIASVHWLGTGDAACLTVRLPQRRACAQASAAVQAAQYHAKSTRMLLWQWRHRWCHCDDLYHMSR
jgi:hypothetical protein